MATPTTEQVHKSPLWLSWHATLKELVKGPLLLENTAVEEEDLKGAHHLTVLAEGSDPAQGNAEGSGRVQGIEGNGRAQGNAGGSAPVQGTGGSDLAQGTAGGSGPVQGTAEGSAHAQETAGAVHPVTEGVEIGPDHPPAMGTTRQSRKHFPKMETFGLGTSL